MQGIGISSTRTLNFDRERGSMSVENVDIADSPVSRNTILKNLRLANVNRLICAQLYINSIRNKLEYFKEIVSTIADTLLQFVIFKPLSYCIEETIGFDVNASFARSPVSRLIKPGDVTKEF